MEVELGRGGDYRKAELKPSESAKTKAERCEAQNWVPVCPVGMLTETAHLCLLCWETLVHIGRGDLRMDRQTADSHGALHSFCTGPPAFACVWVLDTCGRLMSVEP